MNKKFFWPLTLACGLFLVCVLRGQEGDHQQVDSPLVMQVHASLKRLEAKDPKERARGFIELEDARKVLGEGLCRIVEADGPSEMQQWAGRQVRTGPAWDSKDYALRLLMDDYRCPEAIPSLLEYVDYAPASILADSTGFETGPSAIYPAASALAVLGHDSVDPLIHALSDHSINSDAWIVIIDSLKYIRGTAGARQAIQEMLGRPGWTSEKQKESFLAAIDRLDKMKKTGPSQ
jgi:hypothetical protein